MENLIKGYRGLTVIMVVNSDRIFTIVTMVAGLLAGAFLGTSILNP